MTANADVSENSPVDTKRTRRFAADGEAHLRDLPTWCSRCGSDLRARGVSTEYWSTDQRIYYVWCGTCGWTGEVTPMPNATVSGHGLVD